MLELTNAQKSYLRGLYNLHPYDLKRRVDKLNSKLTSVVSDSLLTSEHEKLWWKREMILNLLLTYAIDGYKPHVHYYKYELFKLMKSK